MASTTVSAAPPKRPVSLPQLSHDLPPKLAVLAVFCMSIAALLWGSSFFFINIALGGFDAVTITVTRCLVGGIVVGLFAIHSRRRRRVQQVLPKASWRSTTVAVGATGFFTIGALFGVAVGQGTVSSSLAGIILGTVPVWTALMLTMQGRFQGKRETFASQRNLMIALVLGLTAVMLPSIGSTGTATKTALAVLFMASLSHAASMVLAPIGVMRLGPTTSTSLVMLAGTTMLAPLLFFGSRFVEPTLSSTLALIEISVLPTGLAYVAFYKAVELVGAARASIAVYMIPLVAVVTGTVIGGEYLTVGALLGGACALSAVVVAILPTKQRG